MSQRTTWNPITAPAVPVSGGTGTVTSVAQSVPTGLQVSGSPVTTSGTLAISYASGYQGFLSADKSKLDLITLGGALTTSGAFTTTLTVSGNTNVTLPPTGTLATTSQLSGFVTSVTGTADQISSTGGTTPVLSLPAVLVIDTLEANQITVTGTGLAVQGILNVSGASADITNELIVGGATTLYGATLATDITASTLVVTNILVAPTFTLATLPVTANLGAIICVSNANLGVGTIAFGDGSAWIDVKTGLAVV